MLSCDFCGFCVPKTITKFKGDGFWQRLELLVMGFS